MSKHRPNAPTLSDVDHESVYRETRRWAYWADDSEVEELLDTAERRAAVWESRWMNTPDLPLVKAFITNRMTYWQATRGALEEHVYDS